MTCVYAVVRRWMACLCDVDPPWMACLTAAAGAAGSRTAQAHQVPGQAAAQGRANHEPPAAAGDVTAAGEL